MGCGSYSVSSFKDYSRDRGYTYDTSKHRISGHKFDACSISNDLNAFEKIRECCDSEEHPNTVPVILALDVTGSMGSACDECAASISALMKDLYEKFKDIEVMVMGVGDFECDIAPLQVSQFESDIRVAKQMDSIWLEKGGGGNNYESYTAPWWFGLYRTKLDCFDRRGRKGIIITMGDEPLNPILHKEQVFRHLGESTPDNMQYEFETSGLYKAASKKFDIYHITVQDSNTVYNGEGSGFNDYKEKVDNSFKNVIGANNYIISSINGLKNDIVKLISRSYEKQLPERLIENSIKYDGTGAIIW